MIRCYRCGKAIEDSEISSVVIAIKGEIQRETVCKDCAELLLEEMTPALIPGYSVSRLDVMKKQLEVIQGKSVADLLTDEIRALKLGGMTIPEIAEKFNVGSKSIMDFINRG